MTEEGFAEVFEFLHSSREDLRKMAVRGIAQQSKDNAELYRFLCSPAHGPRSIDALLQFLHAGGVQVLGDILTILINCSAEGGCAEMLVTRKIVRKAMRLLDGIESSDHEDALKRSLEEMTLMLLSNLSASHISAVDDLLQMADEDLRGFYLGKLQVFYDRFNTDAEGEEEGKQRDEAEEEREAKQETEGNANKPPVRDLQRWILQILLNLTRSTNGQELLMEDEDWRRSLTQCLGSPNERHRMLAAQCYRNCSLCKEQHPAILRGNCVRACLERLCDGSERVPEVELLLAEVIAGMMQSEEGMLFLEEVNTKKHLQSAIAGKKVHDETADFLSRHVLPLLDDVVDAYVIPEHDNID
ncbi:uncharacterized protein TM35_000051420 [Trypanosoma theileri]|uniref:Protein HGH1 homolog n=1 Tax=Trypanosoma theileri TaxID=67003 RepID=A0A1X0P3N1_9TRYP|nr:uncharacterized protein TM35_000051420 [Trypanosoma theileri]ORC91546.1 hypothetical protein TM35_000051420 [Trypanosoma theileri]